MLSNLLNRPCVLHRPTGTVTEDAYGNSTATRVDVATVGELQQRRRDEPEGQGETSESDWVLFLPAGTEVTTADTVTVDPLGDFEFVGQPWPVRNPRTQQESHLECSVKKAGT